MAYLNTGLNLRLPLESDYNAFRRFLVTNRHSGLDIYRSLSRELKQPSAKWKGKPAVELAQLAERRRCEELGIDYQAPHSLQPRVAIRNCPECAQQCYHNYLYQYPWIVRCPFHDLPLVEQCPGCQQDWPTPGTLKKRQCLICGSNIKMSHVLMKRKFNDSDFKHLLKIEEAIACHDSIVKAYLFSGQCDPKGCHEHYSIEPHSLHFPSYICSLDARYRSHFFSLGITLEKTVQEEYCLESTDKSPSWPVTNSILKRTQRRIQKQVLRSIKNRFNLALEEVELPWCDQYQRIENLPRLLKTTYNIWLGLLSNGMLYKCQSCNLTGSVYFCVAHYNNMPPEPRFMWGLKAYSSPYDIIDACSSSRPQIQLSSQIAVKLYQLDAWVLFLIILQYLDCLSFCLEEKEDWVGFYDTLPRSVHPATWFDDQYGLYLTSEEKLKIVLPSDFASYDLENISLYTESAQI